MIRHTYRIGVVLAALALGWLAIMPARAADVLRHVHGVLGEFAAALGPLAPAALPEFDHLLTHFRLKISPWLISGSAPRLSEPPPGLPDGKLRRLEEWIETFEMKYGAIGKLV